MLTVNGTALVNSFSKTLSAVGVKFGEKIFVKVYCQNHYFIFSRLYHG